jgi:hypothetical protein
MLFYVALVTLHQDLSVRDHPKHTVQLWGYIALALVAQETFPSLLVVTLNGIRTACHVGCRASPCP